MTITVVGLGPGDPALLTREAWDVLSQAREVYLRTSRHPTVTGLPDELAWRSFDTCYKESESFEQVYEAISKQVLQLGRRPEGVVYAVPGHPLMGEATVTALLEMAAAEEVNVRIVAGLSFVEPILTALGVDGMVGLQVIDALDVACRVHPPINPDAPALLGQLYDRQLAGDVKLTLMNQYPADHQVSLVHSAGSPDEVVETVPLYTVDHSDRVAHLTALYIPALPHTSGFYSFLETIGQLRGPDGCPWDQRQTHQSLASGLIEETAEVLDALASDDMAALCEELGDLLLHIVMQAQIASEDGDFGTGDVIAAIEAKIRRRHPHVFGDATVTGTAQVLTNWDAIKKRERAEDSAPGSALDGIPTSLSALTLADLHGQRAAAAGFDWPALECVLDKVREEMDELVSAADHGQQTAEMGDLMFAIVNWARWLEIDPELALRQAVLRFQRRFRALEVAALEQAGGIQELDPARKERLWQQSRPG